MEYDIQDGERTSEAVLRAVSALEGADPRNIPKLAGVVDPDALDALFEPRANGEPRTGGRVTFVYAAYRVTVEHGEYLTLEPLEGTAAASTGRELERSDPRGPTDR